MRNAAFLAVGVFLILVQANLYRVLAPLGAVVDDSLGTSMLHGATPSLVLPLIIFLGVHEPSMGRGALLTAGIGYSLDLFASAPVGLFTFVSVAIFVLARAAGVRLTAQHWVTQASLAMGFAVVEGAIVLVLLAIFGSDAQRPLEMFTVVPARAVSTAIFSPFVFKLAQRLHTGSLKTPEPVEGAPR